MTTAATGSGVELPLVGPYRIVAAIGAGGSARIDLARIERAYKFQRHVVIKRPLEHLRADRSVAASLQREARIGGRLRHPNLVAVLDAGTHDGYDYLALEYIHGASLRTLMQTEVAGQVREIPLAVSLGIAIDVARGMHDAHELVDTDNTPLGLVHRDVSPGNVLIGLDGTVKLADFGIAKETRVSTLSGSMHGTVTYMAPEQCRGHAFDRRADLFSLGVIIYELVTGTRLFWADNDVASLHRVLSGNVTRPRKLRPNISAELDDIIMTAVAHDADKRFATARDFADALEQYAGAAGLVLGARQLARTMEEVVGPRHAPWIGGKTLVDIPRGDGSLVDIITSDIDEAAAGETFGPSDPHVDTDDVGAPPAQIPRPHRRSKTQLAVVIGLGLVLGSIATVLVMSSLAGSAAPTEVPGSSALTSPPMVRSSPEQPSGLAPAPVPPLDPPSVAPVETPAVVAPTPTKQSTKSTKSTRRLTSRVTPPPALDAATSTAKATAPPVEPPPPPPPTTTTTKPTKPAGDRPGDWDEHGPLFPGGPSK